MADCPKNPDIMLRDIISIKKRTLAAWGLASLVIVLALLFIVYTMVQVILEWHSNNRARTVRLKGRNNVLDPSDDDYDAYPAGGYVAPSGRSIVHRLKAMSGTSKEVLDRNKDNYDQPKEDDEEDM
eukprot:jgi/Tetstr1/447272/TSEL_034709.t1